LGADLEGIRLCVNKTFGAKTAEDRVDYQYDENEVLKNMQLKWNALGTHLYPSAVINNVTFRGELSPANVFEAICSAYETMPYGCTKWLKQEGITINTKGSGGVKKTTLGFIVAVLVIFNCVLIYNYRKKLQKEMK